LCFWWLCEVVIRGTFGKLIKKGLTATRIAELFDTTRQTVHELLKRARHVGRKYFRDKPREPEPSKVTDKVEISILALRNTLEWGTAPIQQGLINLPSFIKEPVRCVQAVQLYREIIDSVLARHGINGYAHVHKRESSSEPNRLTSCSKSTPKVRSR